MRPVGVEVAPGAPGRLAKSAGFLLYSCLASITFGWKLRVLLSDDPNSAEILGLLCDRPGTGEPRALRAAGMCQLRRLGHRRAQRRLGSCRLPWRRRSSAAH